MASLCALLAQVVIGYIMNFDLWPCNRNFQIWGFIFSQISSVRPLPFATPSPWWAELSWDAHLPFHLFLCLLLQCTLQNARFRRQIFLFSSWKTILLLITKHLFSSRKMRLKENNVDNWNWQDTGIQEEVDLMKGYLACGWLLPALVVTPYVIYKQVIGCYINLRKWKVWWHCWCY